MKFKSPTDLPVQINLTNGHTCLIPGVDKAPDGVDIHPMFHREAIARGAEPVGVATMNVDPGSGPNRSEIITKQLQVMLDGNEESDFKKDGTPDLNALSRRCGFKVQREESESIFRSLQETTT